MVTGIRTIVRRLLLLALLASAGVGWSDRASAQARAMPGTDWVPVDPALLDDLRGGFQLPSGLLVSEHFTPRRCCSGAAQSGRFGRRAWPCWRCYRWRCS